jgi:ABC-type phosphate/phosphonate transport system substrate-binding protein
MDLSNKKLNRRQCLTLLAAASAATLTPGFSRGENGRKILRVAVSTETLAGTNINDARAAYRVWINEISRLHGLATAEPVADVFIPSAELIRDVRQGTIDFFGITALEYMKIIDLTDPDTLVLQDYVADGFEYVLLVHSSSPFKKIADLGGAQVVSHFHRDLVLLPAWLGTMLAAANLPPAEHFFGSLTSHDKLNQVLLPVFFRRLDGACVARRNWETAVELNPQLGRDLRPLAVSPKVVPILVAFHRNSDASGRKLAIDSMLHISTTIAGQQIAALYQSRAFVLRPTSVMKATLEMMREFERLPAQQVHSRKGPS